MMIQYGNTANFVVLYDSSFTGTHNRMGRHYHKEC
jgi:hypothetical protein